MYQTVFWKLHNKWVKERSNETCKCTREIEKQNAVEFTLDMIGENSRTKDALFTYFFINHNYLTLKCVR